MLLMDQWSWSTTKILLPNTMVRKPTFPSHPSEKDPSVPSKTWRKLYAKDVWQEKHLRACVSSSSPKHQVPILSFVECSGIKLRKNHIYDGFSGSCLWSEFWSLDSHCLILPLVFFSVLAFFFFSFFSVQHNCPSDLKYFCELITPKKGHCQKSVLFVLVSYRLCHAPQS